MLFVSPHLDDAVLACGGLIAATARRGSRAFVVSVFAGDEPSVSSMGPVALEFHESWGQAAVGPMRRKEDLNALAILGAGVEHLSFQEVIYRRDHDGGHRCRSREDIFSTPTEVDRSLTKEIAGELLRVIERLRPCGIFGPAGVGNHVDHVIVRAAVTQAISQVAIRSQFWYEEMPYSTSTRGAPMLRALPSTALPVLAQLTEQEWELKLAAISSYESQVPTLWRSGDWRLVLRDHAYEVGRGGLVERLWLPIVLSDQTGIRTPLTREDA